MQIHQCRLQCGVPEIGGDLAHMGSGFQHVGGVAVAQGVAGHGVVFFQQPCLSGSYFNRAPDAGFGDRTITPIERITEANA